MKRGQPARRVAAVALAADLLGEPPAHWHPVIWMGSGLRAARRRWRGEGPAAQFVEGAAGWGALCALAAGAGHVARGWPWPLQGALLKTFLARRALFAAADEVAGALERGDLPAARTLLGWHLVSRDVSALSEAEVAGACIESLAENLSDSVVAPLLAYRVGGLPLAAAYRLTNTADALWGYRTPALEYAGKPAARADDLLNLAPARLTALCALVAAGGRGAGVWARDRHRTASPNAGHPMSAFAGALGVRLDKRGAYLLNGEGRAPGAGDITRATALARRTLWVFLALLLLPRWPGEGRRDTA